MKKLTIALKLWKKDFIFIAILFFLACIFLWKILLNPDQMVYFGDTTHQFYPWRFFAENILAEGQLPFWLPHTFSGEPFIANMQTALFYPFNIAIFTLFPTAPAFGYSYLLHLFLAGLFMYLFLRYIKLDRSCAFLASIIFMYSGYFIAHTYAGHYSLITAACWLPLIFLFFEMAVHKKSVFYGFLTGIPIGIQLLAGHLQTSFYTIIALFLYLLFRSFLVIRESKDYKAVSKLFFISASALIVGVALSAIQLFPSFELSQYVIRAGGASYEFVVTYSLPLHNFITFGLPNFFGNPIDMSYWNFWNYWELSLYIGILTLVLISFAIYFKRKNKYVIFFTGLGVLSLLLALGESTPLYWVLWKFVPGFNMFRVPARFLFLFTFSASIIAGFGFNFLKEKLTLQEKDKLWKFVKVFAVLIVLLCCIVVAIYLGRNHIIHFGQQIMEYRYSVYDLPRGYTLDYFLKEVPFVIYLNIFKDLLGLLVLSIVSLVILIFRLKNNRSFTFKNFRIKPTQLFVVIVIVFILLNLWFYHMPFIDTKHPDEIYNDSDYITFLKENSAGYRVHDVDKTLYDNFQIVYGINETQGYNPLILKNYAEVMACIHNLSDNQHHPVLNLLNVKYILTSSVLNNSGFKLVFNNNNTYIYENEQVLPRVFVVYNVTVETKENIIQILKNNSFNPTDALLTDEKIDITQLNGTGFGSVEINSYSPNEIILNTNLTKPGFLVLSEIYYPGWNAYVDEEEQNIFPAYHALRAIYIDAGMHTVRFSFDPSSFRMGYTITLLTLIFLAIVISMKIIVYFKKSLLDSVRRK